MKQLLTDIELDFYELKCLLDYLDKNPLDEALHQVASRSLKNLSNRMDELNKEFVSLYGEKSNRSCQPLSQMNTSEIESCSLEEKKCLDELGSKEDDVEVVNDLEESEIVEKKLGLNADIAESTPSKGSLYRALSLNDVFRFSRELFEGDSNKLKEAVAEMEKLGSYEQAIGYLSGIVSCNIEDYAFKDMDDFLQRYFKI